MPASRLETMNISRSLRTLTPPKPGLQRTTPEGVAFEYDVLDVKEAANLRAGETYLDQAPD
jgi:hypothetical protein